MFYTAMGTDPCILHTISCALLHPCCVMHFLADFQIGRDALPTKRRPPLSLLTNVTVVVAARLPCQGSRVDHKDTSLAQLVTPNKVPHRVPNPVRQSFRCILHFATLSHKVPSLSPVKQSF